MVPALAIGLLTLVGIAVLAIVRSPLTTNLSWGILGLCILLGGYLFYSDDGGESVAAAPDEPTEPAPVTSPAETPAETPPETETREP